MSSTTTSIECNRSREDDYDRLLRWRCEELRRAGYDLGNAILLAVKTDVDLRHAIDLHACGCPSETALRILA